MSELIDNQSKRQAKLQDLIRRVHNQEGSLEALTEEFKQEFGYITGAELAEMEYNLVAEGGVTIEEIQSLCDVHASVFKGTIQQLHSDMLTVNPIEEFEENNKYIQEKVDAAYAVREQADLSFETLQDFILDFETHFDSIKDHYANKENILFPFLEKRGIETIPQVMWGVDNQIRDAIDATMQAANEATSLEDLVEPFDVAIHMINEMIVKENMILFPMLIEELHNDEMREIASSLQHGVDTKYEPSQQDQPISEGDIPMSLGRLSPQEIDAIFNTVPFDMTFVDADDRVKFVTQGSERLFDRPPSVINRPVHLCHPPQSVDVVLDIVNDLRTGVKDSEEFWIQYREKFVYIRYFAVRDRQGKFLGTLEVSQDITDIQRLIGEKRLVEPK